METLLKYINKFSTLEIHFLHDCSVEVPAFNVADFRKIIGEKLSLSEFVAAVVFDILHQNFVSCGRDKNI